MIGGVLSGLDVLALAVFLACWTGYAAVVDRVPSIQARSVIAAMDEHRRRWMIALLTTSETACWISGSSARGPTVLMNCWESTTVW